MKNIKIEVIAISLIILIGFVSTIAVFADASKNKEVLSEDNSSYVQGEIIVKFKNDTESFRVVKVKKGKVMDKVKEYCEKANVVYAEPNYILKSFSNDDYYDNQWALNNIGQNIYSGCNEIGCDVPELIGNGFCDADVDFEEASNMLIEGSAIIAILDSGIDKSHPDLKNKIIQGYDFANNDNDPDDVYGHGTHVAGIAAAQTNNHIGIAGVAFPDNVKIMPVKVLGDSGYGPTSSVVAGIEFAADNGANVINMSLGGGDSHTMKAAVDYAWSKGVLLVAAAGNDGGRRKYYPASYSNVISVAATDYNDRIASFSNFNSQVEISAPGVNVFSTFPTYGFVIQEKYGRSLNYDVANGTSMSTPHVAGLAGLLFAQDTTRTNVEVRNIINKSADDLGKNGWDKNFGWGRINVYNALTYIEPITKCGNGTVESGEECDDGNTIDGDGCSSICQIETVPVPFCGDSKCDRRLGENKNNCPEDCSNGKK